MAYAQQWRAIPLNYLPACFPVTLHLLLVRSTVVASHRIGVLRLTLHEALVKQTLKLGYYIAQTTSDRSSKTDVRRSLYPCRYVSAAARCRYDRVQSLRLCCNICRLCIADLDRNVRARDHGEYPLSHSMCLANRMSISAYVVADAPTSVLVIEQETFWSLVYAEHTVARNMLMMTLERMHTNNALVAKGARLREQHRRQTKVDALTGLRNRAALVDLLCRQMLRSAMGNRPLAVLMVEIDHFRRFAWEFGHAAGEEVLYTVAQILQDQARPTDIAARLDGDHRFAIILPDCDENGARGVARRLCEEVSKAVIVMLDKSILPPMTVSIGIAEMHPFEKAEDLLNAADYALGRVRSRGRGTLSA